MKLTDYIKTKERELKMFKHLLKITKDESELKKYIQTYMALSIAKNERFHNVPAIRFLISEGVSHTEFLTLETNGIYSTELDSETIEEHKEYLNLNIIDKITLNNTNNLNQEVNLDEICEILIEKTEIKNFTVDNSIYREIALNDLINFEIYPSTKHKYIKSIIDKSYFINEVSNKVFYFVDNKVIIDTDKDITEYDYGTEITINSMAITLTEDGLKIYEMLSI